MSGEIKVGDMVMVTRGMPCCGHLPRWALVPWVVRSVVTDLAALGIRCGHCGRVAPACDPLFLDTDSRPWNFGGLRSMLIKLPPPAVEQEAPAPPVAMPDRVIA